jgi:hypothetical protein
VGQAIEFLAATKELIVALDAGIYVLSTLRHRRQQRQQKADAESHRLRLDKLVDRTVPSKRNKMCLLRTGQGWTQTQLHGRQGKADGRNRKGSNGLKGSQ